MYIEFPNNLQRKFAQNFLAHFRKKFSTHFCHQFRRSQMLCMPDFPSPPQQVDSFGWPLFKGMHLDKSQFLSPPQHGTKVGREPLSPLFCRSLPPSEADCHCPSFRQHRGSSGVICGALSLSHPVLSFPQQVPARHNIELILLMNPVNQENVQSKEIKSAAPLAQSTHSFPPKCNRVGRIF